MNDVAAAPDTDAAEAEEQKAAATVPEFSQDILVNNLPEVLDYTGEFGAELVLFLPFCNWLAKAGMLQGRKIRTYRGMRCFYDDLGCEIIEKKEKRKYMKPEWRPIWMPVKNEHNFGARSESAWHLFPDMRAKFRKVPLLAKIDEAKKPLLIIHNKHNNEWSSGPINHLSLEVLTEIFERFKDKYDILYIRHGIGAKDSNFSDDHNWTHPFEDRALLDKYPEVMNFDDLYEEYKAGGGDADLNTFKNALYARSYHFISSQGGGAHHIAMFPGTLFIVYHRRGIEEYWAYGDGYYSFMARVPPVRAICRTEADLSRSLDLLENTAIIGDRVLVAPEMQPLLTALSPWTIAKRKPAKFVKKAS